MVIYLVWIRIWLFYHVDWAILRNVSYKFILKERAVLHCDEKSIT